MKLVIKHVKHNIDHITRINKQLLKHPVVSVGVSGSKATQEKRSRDRRGKSDSAPAKPITLVQVATIHEFGAPGANIPERSFIRSTIRERVGAYKVFLQKSLKLIYQDKMSIRQSLGILGEMATADIKNKIRSNIPPALKQATINRKGSSTALIDTGQLVGSIAYKVEMDGKK